MVGFTFIRDIAIHLKNCMKDRNKENIFKLYNWQFLNIIRLWFVVIGSYPDKDDLGRLAHPLIETTLGIFKFYPQAKYAPFRLHLIDFLNEFMHKTNIYIPVVSLALSLLQEISFSKKRDKKLARTFDFEINVKVQKEFLKSETFYV